MSANRLRGPNLDPVIGMRGRSPSWIFTVLVLIASCGGCSRRDFLRLHYLNGFVPGTHATFAAAQIAVPPITGDLAAGNHDVGGIYIVPGERQEILAVLNAGASIHEGLLTGLADAGLKPISLDTEIASKNLPPGVDLILDCELQQLQVSKRFGSAQSVHGQYFTMTSRVGLKFTLRSRAGSVTYQRQLLGAEDEPPKPVGAEVFFPLETEPAESLSVAMSRAIGALLADPNFHKLLPSRTSP